MLQLARAVFTRLGAMPRLALPALRLPFGAPAAAAAPTAAPFVAFRCLPSFLGPACAVAY